MSAGIPRTPRVLAHGGESIYYEVIGPGAGPWVVFCHGAGGNHAVWFQQVVALADRYRVLIWDQRGFGLSTNVTGRAAPATAVTDLAALFDRLGITRAHVVGQSMGGWAAAGFCIARPGVALSITLSDTLAGAPVPAWTDGRLVPRSARPELGDHPALGPALRASHPDRALLYQQLGDWGVPAAERMGALAGLLTTVYGPEQLRSLGASGAPVVFIVGADDEIFPPAVVREAASFVPGSEVVEIPGAGHSPYYETPEAYNAVLERQLAGG